MCIRDSYISDETDDTDEEDDEDDNDNETATGILRGRGVQFRDQPFQQRKRARNVVNFESRNLSHPQSDFEAFLLYIPEEVIRTIQMYTNRKVNDIRRTVRTIRNYMNPFSYDEILASFGILLYAGANKDNFTALEDLWHPTESMRFYRAVMSLHRFKFFLRAVRFDNFRNRSERQSTDKLAAIRDIWTLFVQRLRQF